MEIEDLDPLTPKQEKVRKLLQQRYESLGWMLSAIDMYTGLVVVRQASPRSIETVKAARHNKRLWELLEKFVFGGDTFAFFAGHGFMLFAILVHLKRIKSNPKIDLFLAMSGYSEEYIMSPPEMKDATEPIATRSL